jgi:hypothetical protein
MSNFNESDVIADLREEIRNLEHGIERAFKAGYDVGRLEPSVCDIIENRQVEWEHFKRESRV